MFFLIFNLIGLVSFAQSPPPKFTSFTPSSGPVGTTVKIIGTNFSGTVASTIVFFGATKATVSAVSSSTITCTVPVGATYNYIAVTDISYPATVYSPKPFDVTFPCGGLISTSSFAAKQDFTAGSAPNSIAVGDLDRDGKADIVVSNQTSNTISVFRNTSSAATISFAAAQTYTTGAAPQAVALGDLNLDGKLDVAVTNYTPSSVSTFRNTSTVGTVSFATKVDFSTASHPFGLAIGDLDADGYSDIVTANRDANSVSVLRNANTTTASITFSAKVDFTVGVGPNAVVIGDLEGDGEPDLAVVNGTDVTVSILRHTGVPSSMTFALVPPDLTAGTGCRSIAIGDLNLDGKLDLVVGNTNTNPGTISVFLNSSTTTATITYSPKTDYSTAVGLAGTQNVTIGDVDGDGLPDIASANSIPASNTISVFKNTGTGFAPRVDFTPGAWPYAVAIADLNGDGKADLAAVNNSGTSISCFKNLISVTPTMTNGNTATICSGDTVNLALTSNVPSTYIWKASDNVNTSGESTTNQTNDTIGDIITNNTVSVQTVTYTVTPTGLLGCAGTAQTVTVTVNPLPVVSFSGLTATNCINGAVQALTGSPAGGTFSGAGIAGSNFTPSVAGSGTHTVTYTYTNGNGCTNSSSQITQVPALPLAPSICMVTVDTVTYLKNMIMWQKPVTTGISSYKVYRNISSVMTLIGTQSYSVTSLFVDTTAGVSPKTQAHEYAISLVDTCGNESVLSPSHVTIHQLTPVFSPPKSYDLVWSVYQGFPFPDYEIWRDSTDNDKWQKIGQVPFSLSTTFTDPNAPSDSVRYRIAVVPAQPCTSTVKTIDPMAATVKSSKSNSSEKTLNPLSLMEGTQDIYLSVSPNPSKGQIKIQSGELMLSLSLFNVYGENVLSKTLNARSALIDLEVADGIYFLKVSSSRGTVMKKVLVNH